MTMMTKKKVGLLAQYIFWAMMAARATQLSLSHTRVVMLIAGLFILLTLSGMQLQDVLGAIESKKDKIVFLAAVVACSAFSLMIF